MFKQSHAERIGTLPYISYTVMCRCEGYGFQEVQYRVIEIREFLSRIGHHLPGDGSPMV